MAAPGVHSLSNNRIGTVGGAALAEALKINKAVRTLLCVPERVDQSPNLLSLYSLDNNPLENVGASALGNMLKANTVLKVLEYVLESVRATSARLMCVPAAYPTVRSGIRGHRALLPGWLQMRACKVFGSWGRVGLATDA